MFAITKKKIKKYQEMKGARPQVKNSNNVAVLYSK